MEEKCDNKDYGYLTYSVMLALTAVKPIPAVVSHFHGIAESTSELDISLAQDGITFSDGGSILIESFLKDESGAALTVVVIGESAFEVMSESDKRVANRTISGFRYRVTFGIPSASINITKQPIAP